MNTPFTNKYDLFVSPPLQRDLDKNNLEILENSMLKRGYNPAYPIEVRSKGRLLEVIRGQHRLYIARKLKLNVYYIIDDTLTDADIPEVYKSYWKPKDILTAYANSGNENYQYLKNFSETLDIPIMIAARIISNDERKIQVFNKEFAEGKFRATNYNMAIQLVNNAHSLSEKLPYWKTANFLKALKSVLMVDGVSWDHLQKRILSTAFVAVPQTNIINYIAQLEHAYNYRLALEHQVPIVFLYKQRLANLLNVYKKKNIKKATS